MMTMTAMGPRSTMPPPSAAAAPAPTPSPPPRSAGATAASPGCDNAVVATATTTTNSVHLDPIPLVLHAALDSVYSLSPLSLALSHADGLPTSTLHAALLAVSALPAYILAKGLVGAAAGTVNTEADAYAATGVSFFTQYHVKLRRIVAAWWIVTVPSAVVAAAFLSPPFVPLPRTPLPSAPDPASSSPPSHFCIPLTSLPSFCWTPSASLEILANKLASSSPPSPSRDTVLTVASSRFPSLAISAKVKTSAFPPDSAARLIVKCAGTPTVFATAWFEATPDAPSLHWLNRVYVASTSSPAGIVSHVSVSDTDEPAGPSGPSSFSRSCPGVADRCNRATAPSKLQDSTNRWGKQQRGSGIRDLRANCESTSTAPASLQTDGLEHNTPTAAHAHTTTSATPPSKIELTAPPQPSALASGVGAEGGVIAAGGTEPTGDEIASTLAAGSTGEWTDEASADNLLLADEMRLIVGHVIIITDAFDDGELVAE
ncbi:hypothetical protein DFJ73DRAFT_804955 [Zopfochytrium polystomum]|nr:hypothetical protein DFJ73DRAFT_804955 [Zopfochytrium polystomum]